MFVHSQRRSRRGIAALLSAGLLGLAGTGAAWSATAGTATAAHGLRTCAVSDLYVSMGRKEGAAGSVYWPIRFTNTSTTSCTLRGYPGVSVLDPAHRQIGPAATHSGRPFATVVLAPARSVSAVIRTTNGPIGGPCLRTGTYLRIYAPASYQAVLVPASWTICSHLFQVGPVNTQGAL